MAVTARNPYQAVIEAMHEVGQSWEPTNANGQVAATSLLELFEGLQQLCLAASEMTRTQADRATDEIWMQTGGADLLAQIAVYLRRPIESIAETAAQLRRLHEDDFIRMERDDRRAAAWDHSRADDYYGRA